MNAIFKLGLILVFTEARPIRTLIFCWGILRKIKLFSANIWTELSYIPKAPVTFSQIYSS